MLVGLCIVESGNMTKNMDRYTTFKTIKMSWLCVSNTACGLLQGRYIFENGRMYEGEFSKDCMSEFPAFTPGLSGITTPFPDESKVLSIVNVNKM